MDPRTVDDSLMASFLELTRDEREMRMLLMAYVIVRNYEHSGSGYDAPAISISPTRRRQLDSSVEFDACRFMRCKT